MAKRRLGYPKKEKKETGKCLFCVKKDKLIKSFSKNYNELYTEIIKLDNENAALNRKITKLEKSVKDKQNRLHTAKGKNAILSAKLKMHEEIKHNEDIYQIKKSIKQLRYLELP